MPRKGEKMSPEQRAKIRAALKARSEQEQAARSEGDVSFEEPDAPTAPGESSPVADIVPPQGPPPVRSLGERIRELAAKKPKPKTKKGAETADLSDLFGLLVLPLSAFVSTQAAQLFEPDYRECAPTQAEVRAFLYPCLRMIERRLSISVRLTPDIADLMELLKILTAYISRSLLRAMEIRERTRNGNNQHTESSERGKPGRTDQSATAGTFGSTPRDDRSGFVNDGTIEYGFETDEQRARRIVREALQQDTQYRVANGLL